MCEFCQAFGVDLHGPYEGTALGDFPSGATQDDAGASFADFSVTGSRWTDSGNASGNRTTALGGSGGVVAWSLAGSGWANSTGTSFFTGSTVALAAFLPFDFQAVLRSAFDAWSEVANIEFIQVQDNGGNIGVGAYPTIRIAGGFIDGQSGSNVLARGFFPSSSAAGGDIVFDRANTTFYSGAQNFFLTAVHEIGHAIGLNHENASLAIMNPSINTSLSGLQIDDINGSWAVYGTQDFGENIYYMPASLANLTLFDGAPALTIVGNSLGNSIVGSTAGETIDGGAGNDTLEGGLGRDGAVFNSARAQTVLTNNHDGTWTALGPDGMDTLRSIEVAHFGDGNTFLSPSHNDLDGDSFSDLIFQHVDGTVAAWQLNAEGILSSAVIGAANSVWQVKHGADFSGDGNADLLFQSGSTGEVAIWNQDGFVTTFTASIGQAGAWQVAGAGDINGDGYADIIFQNASTGDVYGWQLDGSTQIAAGFIGAPGTGWQVKGVDDFGGDGRADLLFQNGSTGEVAIWNQNGLATVSTSVLGQAGAWQVKGAGDFNGDACADIVFQNGSTGDVYVWELNGSSAIGMGIVGTPGTAWQVVGTGDFNADGKADLALQNNSTGKVVEWQMDGTTLSASVPLLGDPTTAWHIVA